MIIYLSIRVINVLSEYLLSININKLIPILIKTKNISLLKNKSIF
jgi:hypothetical protein